MKLTIQIPENKEEKEQLFELIENNDDLMLEVLSVILEVSEKDQSFRDKVLNKVFETNYLARQFNKRIDQDTPKHSACCKSLIE